MAGKKLEKHEYEPRHDAETLKKKIKFLEEELVRKDKAISKLKEENELLFKTAVKNSQSKVESIQRGKGH